MSKDTAPIKCARVGKPRRDQRITIFLLQRGNMKLNVMARALTFALMLAGCGGEYTPTANTAEGFWVGTSNAGYGSALVVLGDGQAFGLSTANKVIYRGLYASIVGKNSTLSGGSGRDYDFVAHTISSLTSSGTVSAKSSLSLSTSSGFSLAAAYRPSYSQAAAISSIAGTYSGFGILGTTSTTQSIPVTIGTDGAVSVAGADCTGTGTTTVKPGATSVFNIVIGFTGANCVLNGTSTIGVVVLDTAVAPSRLYLMSVKNDASDGFFWTSP